MKILLATYWVLPHLGGVWPFMTQMKRKLEEQGHTVDILGHSQDMESFHLLTRDEHFRKDWVMPVLNAKLSPEQVPNIYIHDFVKDYELYRYCMELAAGYFNVGQYDLIHTQDVISTLALNRVRPQHVPLIASIHGSFTSEIGELLRYTTDGSPEKNRQAQLAEQYFYALEREGASAGDVTVCSTFWMKKLLTDRYAIPDQQFAVFPYGLDTDTFYKTGTSSVERDYGKKVIVYTGRLHRYKGVHLLLDALAEVKQYRNDWVCWIAGEGAEEDILRAQAKELGIAGDVRFLGKVEGIADLLHKADMYVLPTLNDNMPFSIMEAQMAGLPAIVSNAGGLPEMVSHGETGLIFSNGDTAGLRNHLLHLLEDDAYRAALGRQAKQSAQVKWSLDTMIGKFMSLYSQELVKKGRSMEGGLR
ncbi:glycosyltransferase family 4 protein [Paenibacillus turpanensis]|uniref:glycosyltransferase family 4 protein n=1 Tax=Paenibacillus turpanensis TaxID=2689078 RepID=UPI001408E387|nr:glycosyltransferase family 4 protein [Paenibacillus turpanensis]